MSSMILPLTVFLIAGLLILGLMVAERYPISTWKDQLRYLQRVWSEKNEPVRVVPQDAQLEDLMIRDDEDLYVSPDNFPVLVDVVEKAIDAAESRTSTWRREVAQRGERAVARVAD